MTRQLPSPLVDATVTGRALLALSQAEVGWIRGGGEDRCWTLPKPLIIWPLEFSPSTI